MNQNLHPAVQKAIERREFDRDVDNYMYWWPTILGAIDAASLRAIADYLDAENAAWDAEVQQMLTSVSEEDDRIELCF